MFSGSLPLLFGVLLVQICLASPLVIYSMISLNQFFKNIYVLLYFEFPFEFPFRFPFEFPFEFPFRFPFEFPFRFPFEFPFEFPVWGFD